MMIGLEIAITTDRRAMVTRSSRRVKPACRDRLEARLPFEPAPSAGTGASGTVERASVGVSSVLRNRKATGNEGAVRTGSS